MAHSYTNILKLTLFFSFFSYMASSQCYMDRHSTNWYDGWTSCTKTLSPNPVRQNSHWLMYSLGHRYVLGESHWWNHNDVHSLNDGVKELAIDYSLDGQNWIEWGTINLDMADGKNTYEGQAGPDFGGVEARYVLITVLDNYGGECMGISEVKIDVKLSTATNEIDPQDYCFSSNAYPNPFRDLLHLKVNSNCSNEVKYYIEDAIGRRVRALSQVSSKNETLSITTSDLVPGIYFLYVSSGDQTKQQKIIKIE